MPAKHSHDSRAEIQPTVTVIITVFNREAYVAEAIESVLAQSWRDFELLIVDDCSTDQSYAIAEHYLGDSRVRLVRNQSNLGDYGNRNHAAQFARGEMLKFHDSDDVMYPHCLEFMVRPLMAEPRAALAMTASRSWQGAPVPMLLDPRLAFEREFHGIGLFNGGPANGLFRTAEFQAAGGFEDLGSASDHLFWLRFCAKHSVLLVNADLFYYRIHAGQEVAWQRSPGASTLSGPMSAAKVEGLVWRFLDDGHAPLEGAALERAKSNWLWMIAKACWHDLKARRFVVLRMRLSVAQIRLSDWLTYFRRPVRHIAAGTPGTQTAQTG